MPTDQQFCGMGFLAMSMGRSTLRHELPFKTVSVIGDLDCKLCYSVAVILLTRSIMSKLRIWFAMINAHQPAVRFLANYA